MNRCVLVWAVLVLALSSISIAADAPPAGTIRWDIHNPQNAVEPTKGPAPAVYNLSRPFNWPEDIEVDDEGCFYVLCHVRQSITKFRPDGSFDKLWLEDTGHPCMGIGMDMAVLPGERIYLASDHWLPTIRRFGPDTNVIENLEGVDAACIVAEEDGTYYLNRWFDMRVYSPDGKPKATWKVEPARSMAFGPDGNIYMPVYNKPTVAVYSTTGAAVRTVDLSGLPVASSLWEIAVDTNGDIYLSCNQGILRLDNAGSPIAFWRPYRGVDDRQAACSVADVAVNNGMVYCLLRWANAPPEVQTFTPDGQCIARYLFPKLDVELPWSIAVQPDGRYAVHQAQTSWGQDSVLLFGPDGKRTGSIPDLDDPSVADVAASPSGGYYVSRYKPLEQVDANGMNPSVVLNDGSQVMEISVDEATGNIYARTDKKQIQVLTPRGEVLRTIKLGDDLGLGARDQLRPTGTSAFMAVDGKGFIYLSDTDNHRILKLDANGRKVGEFGREGSGLGELRRPKGLTVDAEGRMIVADTRNNRIQVFAPDGQPLGVWGRLGIGDGELDRPHGVTLLPGKAVYIADTHNDRVVVVPWSRFWQEVSKEIKAPPPYVAPEKVPMPIPGEVTVEGIVVAGTDDFTDCVYIQAADRSWGTRVTMPTNVPANRGERIKVTGTLELKEHAAKHVKASKSEFVASVQSMPGPLGMANLYVGDGYRMGDRPSDLSNLGLLIKSWGRVLMVDPLNKRFVISDGSRLGSAPGLEVYGGQLKAPLTQWPKIGQYVMVTGISAVRPVGDGTFHPAIRLRAQEDLQVLIEN